MRLRTAWLLFGILCAGSAAEAGLFHRNHSTPKPYDFPVPPPRSLEYRPKPGNLYPHPGKYEDPNWGRETKKVYKSREHHFSHSLFR